MGAREARRDHVLARIDEIADRLRSAEERGRAAADESSRAGVSSAEPALKSAFVAGWLGGAAQEAARELAGLADALRPRPRKARGS
jgi:hypothetical protein